MLWANNWICLTRSARVHHRWGGFKGLGLGLFEVGLNPFQATFLEDWDFEEVGEDEIQNLGLSLLVEDLLDD